MLRQDGLITRYGLPEESACIFNPNVELELFSCTGTQNDQPAFSSHPGYQSLYQDSGPKNQYAQSNCLQCLLSKT